jgi:DNA-directed RNA polymerase specialized sigma24 family protein
MSATSRRGALPERWLRWYEASEQAERERCICQRYSNRIRAYGLRHLRDSAAAEDLVQQVLLVVLQALRNERVNDVDNLEKYVFGTCRNTVMDMRLATPASGVSRPP